MKKVAVVGAGIIGTSWAKSFLRAGCLVNVMDSDADRLRAAGLSLDAFLCDNDEIRAGRYELTGSLRDAAMDVDLVQESGPENLDFKKAIFAELDGYAPEATILASSSSALVSSLFTSDLKGRHRCLIAHPVNPPHLLPLVELCGSPHTSPDTMARAKRLYSDAGHSPILVNKEINGFVQNRLHATVIAEALRLVGEGVVSAEDIDKTLTEGLGMRWSFLGLFGSVELNAPDGLADYFQRYGGPYSDIAASPATAEVWEIPNIQRLVESWGHQRSPEELARRSAWRDRRLESLRRHKATQESAPPEHAHDDGAGGATT